MNHLAEKWKIEGMEDDVDLASGSLLTAIGDEDDDGKQINGEDNDTIGENWEESKRLQGEKKLERCESINPNPKYNHFLNFTSLIAEAQIKLAEKKKEEEEERNKDKFDPKNRSEKTYTRRDNKRISPHV